VMIQDNDTELGTLTIYNMDVRHNVNTAYTMYQELKILHRPFDEQNVDNWLDEEQAVITKIVKMQTQSQKSCVVGC